MQATDGVRLSYTTFGRRRGEPVLLVQGLGVDSTGWLLQRPAIGARYRGITFDNRGVGRSERPAGPYSLHQMADDALSVLDAVGVESAHVVGASMGGVIAQLVAGRHPDRVRSLVLACTACRHLRWRRELLTEWAAVAEAEGMPAFAAQNLRWLVGSRSLRRFWPAFGVLTRLALTAPTHAFVAQVQAILAMDDDHRFDLAAVTAPTLVLVGSQDVLTPQADAEELAELIPHAELAVIRGASHGFMVEHARTFNRTVLDFLGRVVAGDARPATAVPAALAAADDERIRSAS
jgi:3-oxoadipate enol-lactonase